MTEQTNFIDVAKQVLKGIKKSILWLIKVLMYVLTAIFLYDIADTIGQLPLFIFMLHVMYKIIEDIK